MTGTNHGLTGAVIALLVKEPLLAVPLSFASHFACDAIPHYGVTSGKLFTKRYNIMLTTDFLVAVGFMVIFGFMFPAQKWVIWFCMVAAASPDLMWAYYRLYVETIKKRTVKKDPLARFHTWIQWSQTAKGTYIEILWAITMGAIILSQR